MKDATLKFVSHPSRFRKSGQSGFPINEKRVPVSVSTTQDGVVLSGLKENRNDKDAGKFETKVRKATIGDRLKAAWKQSTTFTALTVASNGAAPAGALLTQLVENFKPGTKVAYEVVKEGEKPERRPEQWLISGESVAQKTPSMTAKPSRHEQPLFLGANKPKTGEEAVNTADGDANNYEVKHRKPTLGEKINAAGRFVLNTPPNPLSSVAPLPPDVITPLATGIKEAFHSDNLVAYEVPKDSSVAADRAPQKWLVRPDS